MVALNTYTSKFQQYFRENLLGFHPNTLNGSGKLLEENANEGDKKSEDNSRGLLDEEGDQPLNGSVNKKVQPPPAAQEANNNVQNTQGAPLVQKREPSPVYLFYALAGCVSFSLSGILRKYQGQNVFFANSIMTIAFMVVAIIHFIH